MELVEGASLDRLIGGCPLDPVEAEHLARQVISGVRAAHALGMVHRDLKPANVLVALDGEALVAKVADFGIAKLLDDDGAAGSTRSGVALGTPRYMAPEQIRDASTVDERADLFSLGALMFELFTGIPAFQAEDAFEIQRAIVDGRRRSWPPGVPDRLRRAVEGCLEPDRAHRVPTCDALLAALDEDGGPPAPRWRTATVARVRALARTPMERPSAATYGASSSATPAEAPLVRSRHRLVGVAILAVVAIALVVGLVRSLPGPRIATVGGLPPLEGGAEIERAATEGWERFLDNDDPQAERAIADAANLGATDPLVHLLHAAVALGVGRRAAFESSVARAAEHADPTDPPGALALALHASLVGADPVSPIRDHLARYPRDHFARLLLAQVLVHLRSPDAIPVARTIVDADPHHALGWMLLANAHFLTGDREGADRAAEEGLAHVPRDGALMYMLAISAIDRGDCVAGMRRCDQALRTDPGWIDARVVAARAALCAGDTAAFERYATAATAPDVPAGDRVGAAMSFGYYLFLRGRVREAAAWYERGHRIAVEAGDSERALDAITSLAHELADPWLAPPALARDALQRAEEARSAATDVPPYLDRLLREAREGRAFEVPRETDPCDLWLGYARQLLAGGDRHRAGGAFERAVDRCGAPRPMWEAALHAGVVLADPERPDRDAHVAAVRGLTAEADPDVPLPLMVARIAPRAIRSGLLHDLGAGWDRDRTLGLVPLVGDPDLASVLSAEVERRLRDTPGVRVGRDPAAELLSGEVARIGERVLVNLLRTDPASGRPVARVSAEADRPEEAVDLVEGLLVALLVADALPPVHLDVQATVDRYLRPTIRSCTEDASAGASGLARRIEVRFHLGPVGRPDAVEVETDTVGDPALARCVTDGVRATLFPVDLGVDVAFPFVFGPEP